MSKTTGVSEQILSLPKGGGSINGLGEKFRPDLHTGTGVYNIPLDIPNGPNDIAPKLNLSYNSASGNGPFGMGFSLNLLTISRSIKKCLPTYTDKDTLVLEGAGNLLEISDGVFRVETDPYGWKIETIEEGFHLTDKNGLIYKLGISQQSRLFKKENSRTRNFKWFLEEIEDPMGNKVYFEYLHDNGKLYIKRIGYSIYSLEFNYENRNDTMIDLRAGFSIVTRLRCLSIELSITNSKNPVFRRWNFSYKESLTGKHSLLHKIMLTGFDEEGKSDTLPVLTLDYTSFNTPKLQKFKGELPNVLPDSYKDGRRELVDFTGDGIPDLLEIRNGIVRTWENKGECVWAKPRIYSSMDLPPELNSQSVAFADMSGDGTADLIFLDSKLNGYYPLSPGGGFKKPVFWKQSPHAQLKDSNTKLLDLNGDGITDLLSIGKDYYCLYFRDKEKGWTERPVTIPLNLFPPIDINDPHVHFADMTGDGLQDIVKIDGSVVKFWPCLGNGMWGEKQELKNDHTIPRNYEPKRMFLADIDGDGCSDLVYVDFGRVLYWINTSGSYLSDPVVITGTPTSDVQDIRIADMKGTGTPGILWAYETPGSRRIDYFYLEISGGQKPYLLNSISNGMGLETSIVYSASTKERQRDVKNGEPWNTFLPFPVPVVSSINSFDLVTQARTVTRYRYHEGHYEGTDGEFAGFGRVEIIEEGDESVPTMITRNYHHLGCEPGKFTPAAEKLQLKSLRGKLLKSEVMGIDNSGNEHLYNSTINEWSTKTSLAANEKVMTSCLLIETKTTYFDNDLLPFRITSTRNLEYDNNGNILLQQQEAYEPVIDKPNTVPSKTKILNTRIHYAKSSDDDFLTKPSRVIQTDGDGRVVSLSIQYYDNLPEGQLGNKGLVTSQEFLAIDDNTVERVYKGDIPDFLRLGYYRKEGEEGWWASGNSYAVEDIEGIYTGKITNPFGEVTGVFYEDTRIYPEKLIDAMGNSTTATFDFRANKLKTLTDANGSTVEQKYDSLGRLLYTIEPGASHKFPTESYKYITDSLPAYILCEKRPVNGSPDIICHKFFLDGSGNVIEERILRDGHEFVNRSCILSTRGLLKEQFVPFSATSESYLKPQGIDSMKIEYDAIGRPLKILNPDSTFREMKYSRNTVFVYDEEDTRKGTNADHTDTPFKNTYDETGRICQVSVNLQNRWISTKYSYDIKGNLIEVLEPEGRKTDFIYDMRGNPLAIKNNLTGESVFVYDALENRIDKRNNKGEKILFEYDSLRRLKEIKDANTLMETSKYVYHDTDNPYLLLENTSNYSFGRAVKVTHQGGDEHFYYDELGRLVKKEISAKGLPGKQLVFDYSYRADGQISSITYPAFNPGDGRVKVVYEYDKAGRLIRIPGYVKKIGYNDRGQRTIVEYNNGTSTVYTYNDKNFRLQSSVTKDSSENVIEDFIYHYDFVGNIIRIDSADEKIATQYSYDDLYRLTKAVSDSGMKWTYEYNDLSDITFKSDIGALLYDSNGKLFKAGNDSYDFNQIGQLVSSPMGEFSYDAAGKLICAIKGNERMDISYDHQGRRIALRYMGPDKTTDIFTPDEMISVEDGIMYIMIQDGSQCIARLRQDNGNVVYLHKNHLGSTSKVSSANGSILQSIYYDPFGAVLENITDVGGEEIRIMFTGKECDFFTELVYMSSRYYCPKIARFITPDTVIPGVYNPMAWNRYSYVLNNPLRYLDPSGHFWDDFCDWVEDNWKTIVAIVAVVAVIALTVVTFGAGALIGVGVGMVVGGVVGGIAASQAGGDVLLGVLTGMALGGAASLAGLGIGAGMTALMGNGLTSTLIAGTLSGAVTGGAMGLAAGYAGGAGTGSLMWDKFWKGALTGAITGLLFSLAAYGFQNNWFTGPEISIETPTAETLEKVTAETVKKLGQSQDAGNAATTFVKELGKSVINTDKGYPILKLVLGEVAAPIWQNALNSTFSAFIVLDYGDDLIEFLKENDVKLELDFKW